MIRWLDGEPTLDEILSGPTILALMERDEVDPVQLRMFLENVVWTRPRMAEDAMRDDPSSMTRNSSVPGRRSSSRA